MFGAFNEKVKTWISAVHSVPKGWQNLFSLFHIFGCFYVYKEQKRSIFHTYVLFSLRRATFKFTCSTTLKQYRLIYVLKWANFGTFLCNSTQKYAKTSHFFMFIYPLETTYFIFTYCNILEHCQIRAQRPRKSSNPFYMQYRQIWWWIIKVLWQLFMFFVVYREQQSPL